MGSKLAFARFLILMFLMAYVTEAQRSKLFDVTKYGAIANGRTDNTRGSMDRFHTLDRLSVIGGGTLDGQGASTWSCRCREDTNNNCQACRPVVSMRFQFVKNSRIGYMSSVDSKNVHFEIFRCENIFLTNLKIKAPENSPNTDEIKIANSNQVTIFRTSIGTGDDCVAILFGSRNINISQVTCGLGHGISVGSLGRYPNENDVNGLTVKNCTFKGTTNGLRIKTWASSLASIASGFTFENIFMDNVQNPIIIDQQYCPRSNCNPQVAVALGCSKKFPCKNIVLSDIHLVGSQGLTTTSTSCSHVNGVSHGHQRPPSCI